MEGAGKEGAELRGDGCVDWRVVLDRRIFLDEGRIVWRRWHFEVGQVEAGKFIRPNGPIWIYGSGWDTKEQ